LSHWPHSRPMAPFLKPWTDGSWLTPAAAPRPRSQPGGDRSESSLRPEQGGSSPLRGPARGGRRSGQREPVPPEGSFREFPTHVSVIPPWRRSPLHPIF
jgi:hypothetical protein